MGSPWESEMPTQRSANKHVAMYFDIETIPNPEYKDRFEELFFDGADEFGDPDLFIGLDRVVTSGTVAEIKKHLSSCGVPPVDATLAAIEAERAGKCRAGILGELESALKKAEKILGQDESSRLEMSISPAFLKIIAIGYAFDDGPITTLVANTVDDEDEILHTWWSETEKALQFVGYNCRNFDWPAIKMRSNVLGIKVRRSVNDHRWSGNIVDAYEPLNRYGRKHSAKLNNMAYMLGLRDDRPTDDGSKVQEMYQNDRQALEKYLSEDVRDTRSISNLLRLTEV